MMDSCNEIAHTPSTANAKHLCSILDVLSETVDFTSQEYLCLEGRGTSSLEETLLLLAELPLCLFSPLDIVSACRLEAQSWGLALPSRYRWSEVWR